MLGERGSIYLLHAGLNRALSKRGLWSIDIIGREPERLGLFYFGSLDLSMGWMSFGHAVLWVSVPHIKKDSILQERLV